MLGLLIFGLGLDVAGVSVIALPILQAHRRELREEGTMRWGRNTWVIVARMREQRYVRLGMFLLALGFAVQLGAYVSQLSSPTWMVISVAGVAAMVAITVIAARRWALRGLPRYGGEPRSDRIQDARDVFQVVGAEDLNAFWRIASSRELRDSDEILEARVNHGRWTTPCNCGGGVVLCTELDHAACIDCGTVYAVRFPEEWERIEQVLLAREGVANRNWSPGETVEQVQAENLEHDVPPLFIGGDVADDLPPAAPPSGP